MPEIEEFDFEKFNADYEASLQEDEVVETDEELETVELVDEEETNPEGDGDPSLQETKEDLGSQSEEETKRNTAFANMRRERDEAKRVADWLASVAQQNGTTPEEMMENYQKALLEKQATEQNVPVEILQRLQAIETENEMLKSSTFSERFNAQVEKTIADYGATESDVEDAFKYAADNGLISVIQQGGMSFEALYKLAHLDTITEKRVQAALQEDLSKKKKRQQEASIPNGSSAAQIDESLEERAKRDAAELIKNGGF